MLELTNVKKRFGQTEVLKGVSITVNDGDVVAILGPSGSGKTTLLRCASFLTRADDGTVRLGEDELSLRHAGGRAVQAYRKRTGFVFQNYNLFGNRTALGNITEGLTTARKMDRTAAERIGLDALERVGMLDYRDAYPSSLSGGQQQRVAIARAFAPDPEVLFFDEPTSALDPELTGEVLNVMRDLAEGGATMVVVTHEMEFARRVANRVIFMEGGVIVEENSAEGFFTAPRQQRSREFLNGIAWHAERPASKIAQ